MKRVAVKNKNAENLLSDSNIRVLDSKITLKFNQQAEEDRLTRENDELRADLQVEIMKIPEVERFHLFIRNHTNAMIYISFSCVAIYILYCVLKSFREESSG